MKLGVQTRPWGPEMNRQHLDQVLADVVTAGYDGIEIGAQHLNLSHPEELRARLNKHGLCAAAIHVGGEIHNPEAVRAALAQIDLAIAQAECVGATFLALSGKAKENKSEDEFRAEAESLNRVGARCREHGVRLAYHNHNWEIENDCLELAYLVEHTDPSSVSFLLDIAWVHRAGGNPGAVARRFLDRLAYIHIKDTTPTEWRELGNGQVDLAGVLQVLAARSFPWLIVEQDETQRTALESVTMSRIYLREHLSA